MKAKTVIWHAYENFLPPERRRVTTDNRSANEANLSDIIGAVSDLDGKGKSLDRLPKYVPEETNVMSIMDRMRVVELQLNEVQDLSLRNRENTVKNAKTSATSVAETAVQISRHTALSLATVQFPKE